MNCTSTVKHLRAGNRITETVQKRILELLVYVLHPESASCLGDHKRDILNFSRFSCQKGETWTASITLRSWRADREPVDLQKSSDDIKPQFRLPSNSNLSQVWKRQSVKDVDEQTIFKPEVSSIILSTNSFGDFSKCTVVSEFMDDKMKALSDHARKLFQMFM